MPYVGGMSLSDHSLLQVSWHLQTSRFPGRHIQAPPVAVARFTSRSILTLLSSTSAFVKSDASCPTLDVFESLWLFWHPLRAFHCNALRVSTPISRTLSLPTALRCPVHYALNVCAITAAGVSFGDVLNDFRRNILSRHDDNYCRCYEFFSFR